MHISDQSAHDFVKMIEAGGSIECVIEIMAGLYSTYDVDIREQTKRAMAIDRLIRCEIVRRSALFCALLGVNRIILSPFGYDRRFDKQKDAVLWLELSGYSKLEKSIYRDCFQAWIKKESVAKIQKMPDGKFLVQEFKIV